MSVSAHTAAQRLGQTVGRLRATRALTFDDSGCAVAVRRITVVLTFCWVLALFERYTSDVHAGMGLEPVWLVKLGDLLGLISLGIICSVGTYVFSRVPSIYSVRRIMLLSMICLSVFVLSDFIDEFDSLQAYPLFAKSHPLHVLLENMALTTGALFGVLGLFVAVLEGETARQRLRHERERLYETAVERQSVARELDSARARLEVEVAARTAELAERNEQLRIELQERQRAEAALAMRLRYEEGLAACSQIFLADTEPAGALNRGLECLCEATDSSRVFLFENELDAELGDVARLNCEVWAPELDEQHPAAAERRVVYGRGLTHWQTNFQKGLPVIVRSDSASADEREFLEREGSRTVLLLPVGWEGHWRGFLGFDSANRTREWMREEIRMLQTAAEMVGACRERQLALASLRRAYEELEQRVQERAAALIDANAQLQREISDRQRAETEKLKLASQLRQAQKMQAIGTLAGGIAHDFNNILSSILGYTEMALYKGADESPFARYLNEVMSAGNRAKELVRQILVFSRQSENSRTPVLLQHIAEEVVALLHASTPANVRLLTHIDKGCGPVCGDPIQMHQILMNLCTNAQYAMKSSGGSLQVRVEPARFGAVTECLTGRLPAGDYVRMTVSDTGSGMDGETLDRIFEPFFTTKGVGEGTGMGLAIVHGIVSSLQGGIDVHSAPGEGTCFEILLPSYEGEAQPEEKTSELMMRGSENILVVDDETPLVKMWREMLEEFGYIVTACDNSLDARRIFEQEPERFDLVLLDQTMPYMTGAELARFMLACRPELPIIMATGFSETMTAEHARAIGIRDFVLKPIIARDLGVAIRRALDGRSTAAA